MNKNLYLFDFDGTITKKDSYIDFFVSQFGKWYLFKKIVSNIFPIMKLSLQKDKAELKKKLTFILLKDKSKTQLQEDAKNYFQNRRHLLIFNSAEKEITAITKDPQNDVFIVSASLDLWLVYFAEYFKVKLICTELDFQKDKYVGFKTKNCRGKEKVVRIQKEVSLSDYDNIYAYGNSSGDKEMFELANEYFYKPFNK
ncbi:HAD-IB family phosphatase [Pseudotenacibaculum sp. MALMAid0570]|uniref:HAD-IB family phosphatase n=1 Tax=Pseudotenacibaculum sp. MALMAid0570 TaxID=3143938 RepID=UPI0032DE5F87